MLGHLLNCITNIIATTIKHIYAIEDAPQTIMSSKGIDFPFTTY